MYHTDDTIVAIASAAGGAARGIVRLSGPAVVTIAEACFRPAITPLGALQAATAVNGSLALAGSRADGLPARVYLWPNARSYTRQPVAEIHTLGSPALLGEIVTACCAAGARGAQPGEFTLRAFLAGRIDLTQAEAVLGVIDARGANDFQRALVQLAGGLARPLNQLRETLLDLLAHLEAGLDFAEEDLRFITPREIETQLETAAAIVASASEQLVSRSRSDALPRVVLVGWPNVGKSSLFNALSGRGAALVSHEAGTTRDYLTATIDFGAIRCQLVDTAGIEFDSPEPIGRVARQLSADQSEVCDVSLLCLDSGRPLNAWEQRELSANSAAPRLVVLTKCDAPGRAAAIADGIETSSRSGLGLLALGEAIRRSVERVDRAESAAGLSAVRSADSLRATGAALTRAVRLCRSATGEELIAAEIRLVLAELGKVVGAVYTDDILDRIFRRFCIGK